MRLLLLALLIFASLGPDALSASPEKQKGQGPPPALVVTAEVAEETVRSSLTLTGTALPDRLSTVAAEEGGRIEAVNVREGDRVAEGAAMVTLRPVPLQLELAEARAALREVEALLEKAVDDAGRATTLHRKGFISEEELQARQTDEKALSRKAERSRATVRRLQDRLERLVIRAPYDGQVIEEGTEVGEWVQEGDPVMTLADLERITIRVPVPERHIAGLNRRTEAVVRFDALPEQEFHGTVSAVIPRADAAARTFPVEVKVANAEGRILAGMLARVTFRVGEPRPALLVPKDALVSQPGGGGYVVKVEQGAAAIVPVQVLSSHGERHAVASLGPPLAAGDTIVVRGNERLRPGQRITTGGDVPVEDGR